LFQKVNRENRCVSAVPAAQRKRPIFQISESGNRSPGGCDDLRPPAEIGVAHCDRTTLVAAPLISLQVSKVCIPRDIDMRYVLARFGKEGEDLRLVALEKHDLNGKMRFFVKIGSHPLPN